jgi:signal transduction histidine kinase
VRTRQLEASKKAVQPAAVADWLAGGGEMGERIRAFDWSSTALGPVERWPQSLRSAVSICLPSKAQIILCWGPELITIYNDGYRPVFGAKHPHALGLPVREAWREVWPQGLKDLFEGVLATGEAFWAKDLPFSLERYGYPEEAFFDVSYDPVRDESGGVGGIFCIVNETTGRVVGERRLRTLRDLGTRAAAAKSADDVFEVACSVLAGCAHDVPFAYLYAHDRRYPADAPPSDAWPLDRAAESGLPITIDTLTGVLAALPGGPWPEPAQTAVVLPLGRAGAAAPHGFLVAGVSPRRRLDPDYMTFFTLLAGQVSTALANVQAYEEERKRAEALAEIDRAKTAFFSNVSHEFRTPLTLMLGPIEELLRGRDTLLPPQIEQLTLVRRNSRRLLKLVNTLLDFSRIEAGRAQADYRPVDLAALTADLASSFRSACERAGLTLQVECEPVGTIYVDRDMFEKILLNLLSNAFKYTFDGGVGVSLRDAGDFVRLTVSDTGTGIPDRDLPHLFTRFYRVEGARGRSFEGTGIGLALVQELVHLHGGTIEASSTEGRGSSFTVTLPKGSAHLPAEHVRDAGDARAAFGHIDVYVEEALRWLPEADDREGADLTDGVSVRNAGRRVLLVDDNADLRAYLRHLLEGRFAVETASNGEEAFAAATARVPDVIVADVMMPKLDGFGLLRQVRAHPALSMVPVILLSARAGEEARIEGLQGGADDYLVKPFSARELVARVDSALEIARVRLEADRRKDEFLAVLAHELRNPLAPIRTGLELIRLAGDTPAAVEQVRAVMQRQVSHMVHLVDDLLDVSRITAGKITLQRQLTPLAVMVNSAVDANRAAAAAGQLNLLVRLPDGGVWLDVDPTRFVQVISNVLHNAVKFTNAGGTITIAGELRSRPDARAGELALTVTDTGAGIAPEMLPRVFDLFAQGTTTAERQPGLGIGLALARRLIEMHGGSIRAHSDGPGCGSAFEIRMPVTAQAPDTMPERTAADVQKITRRVLVIDDNADVADLMALHVAALGGDAHTARDGQSGVERALAVRPHVVLIDIGMPGMDGYETCRRIRAGLGRSAMLVAVSGWGQQQDKARAMSAGFDAHVTKPADPAVLASLLAYAEARGAAVEFPRGTGRPNRR